MRLLVFALFACALSFIQSDGCGYEPDPVKEEGEACTRTSECAFALECRGGVCMRELPPPRDAGDMDASAMDADVDAAATDAAATDGAATDAAATDGAASDAAADDAGMDGAVASDAS